MQNILIIEDNKKLNNGIRLALTGEKMNFFQTYNLADGMQVIHREHIDLILLDVNLPDGNGIDFLRTLRKSSNIPVILITVNNMELDIVTGLEAGANDYITKPFSLMVLRARAAVQLRNQNHKKVNEFQCDDFLFRFDKMEFLKAGQNIELSKTEQRLLRLLCENKGGTLKRSYLIDSVWLGDSEFVDEHALTVTIKRLRDKLEEDSANPQYIKTVYGIGYTWAVK